MIKNSVGLIEPWAQSIPHLSIELERISELTKDDAFGSRIMIVQKLMDKLMNRLTIADPSVRYDSLGESFP